MGPKLFQSMTRVVAAGDIIENAAIFTPSGPQFVNVGNSFYSVGVFISRVGDVSGNYTGTSPTNNRSKFPFGFLYLAADGPPSADVHTVLYGDETYIAAANDADAVVGVYSWDNCCSGDQCVPTPRRRSCQ